MTEEGRSEVGARMSLDGLEETLRGFEKYNDVLVEIAAQTRKQTEEISRAWEESSKEVEQAVQSLKEGASEGGTLGSSGGLDGLTDGLGDVVSALSGAGGAAGSLAGDLGDMAGTAAGAVGAVAGLTSGVGILTMALPILASAIVGVYELAEKQRPLLEAKVAFAGLSSQAAKSADEIIEATKRMSRGVADSYSIISAANRQLAKGNEDIVDSFEDLMELADAITRAFGGDTMATFAALQAAMEKGTEAAFHQAGAYIEVEAAQRAYAEQHGKFLHELNEYELNLATQNALLELMPEYIESITTHTDEMTGAFWRLIQLDVAGWFDKVTAGFKRYLDAQRESKENTSEFLQSFDELFDELDRLERAGELTGEPLKRWQDLRQDAMFAKAGMTLPTAEMLEKMQNLYRGLGRPEAFQYEGWKDLKPWPGLGSPDVAEAARADEKARLNAAEAAEDRRLAARGRVEQEATKLRDSLFDLTDEQIIEITDLFVKQGYEWADSLEKLGSMGEVTYKRMRSGIDDLVKSRREEAKGVDDTATETEKALKRVEVAATSFVTNLRDKLSADQLAELYDLYIEKGQEWVANLQNYVGPEAEIAFGLIRDAMQGIANVYLGLDPMGKALKQVEDLSVKTARSLAHLLSDAELDLVTVRILNMGQEWIKLHPDIAGEPAQRDWMRLVAHINEFVKALTKASAPAKQLKSDLKDALGKKFGDWWTAFTEEHGGQTPVDYYKKHEDPLVAAMMDKMAADKYAAEHGGQAPSREWWDARWYAGSYKRELWPGGPIAAATGPEADAAREALRAMGIDPDTPSDYYNKLLGISTSADAVVTSSDILAEFLGDEALLSVQNLSTEQDLLRESTEGLKEATDNLTDSIGELAGPHGIVEAEKRLRGLYPDIEEELEGPGGIVRAERRLRGEYSGTVEKFWDGVDEAAETLTGPQGIVEAEKRLRGLFPDIEETFKQIMPLVPVDSIEGDSLLKKEDRMSLAFPMLLKDGALVGKSGMPSQIFPLMFKDAEMASDIPQPPPPLLLPDTGGAAADVVSALEDHEDAEASLADFLTISAIPAREVEVEEIWNTSRALGDTISALRGLIALLKELDKPPDDDDDDNDDDDNTVVIDGIIYNKAYAPKTHTADEMYQHGGINMRRQLAMLHEDEAIIPLASPGSAAAVLAQVMGRVGINATMPGVGSGMGGVSIGTLNIPVNVAGNANRQTVAEMQTAVVNAIRTRGGTEIMRSARRLGL